jgi:hypothetical protein
MIDDILKAPFSLQEKGLGHEFYIIFQAWFKHSLQAIFSYERWIANE